jgi:hypothetical protein
MAFFTGGFTGGRNSAIFSKAANTTLADVTGITVNVEAAKVYRFYCYMSVSADAVGGYKVQLTGTASATTIRYSIKSVNFTASTIVGVQLSALTTSFSPTVGGTAYDCIIEGTILVNAAGTLKVQFAQSVANGTSSVEPGGTLFIYQMT